MSIAENIKALRKKAKMSQKALAASANVSQQLISQLENGINRDTTRLPELAKALGCSVEAIDPDFYLLPDDADRAEVIDRFKAILASQDADALRSVSDHFDFVLHRLSREKNDTP